MPLPDGVATFTLIADFPPLAPDGTERAGSLTFTPVPPVLVADAGVYLGVENATLSASGTLSKTLVANDALAEPFVWRVDIDITGLPPISQNISVPASAGTIALGTLLETEVLPGSYYVVIGPQGPQGVQGEPGSTAGALLAANNLNDVLSASASRSSLGLGTAATSATGDFDPAGAATAAQTASASYTDTQTATRASTSTQVIAGAGLTGGGTLAADRTLNVSFGASGDVTALGTQAAGSVGKASDAGHVHPTTGVMLLVGDQVISGTITFNDAIPTAPAFDPAFDNQLGRKAYIDAQAAAALASANAYTDTHAGGGSSIRTASVRITDDNLSGVPSAAVWAIVQTSGGTQLKCSIAAATGDRIVVHGLFMRSGSRFLDWNLLDSAGALGTYATSGTSTPPAEGNPTLYPSLSYSYATGAEMFTVGAGDISGGLVTVALANVGTSAAVVYAHATYPWRLRLENIGPEPA